MKERIAVAMSGGVDSSVAAAILKEEGYDVIGINMRIWNYLPVEKSTFGSCCSLEDISDARRVSDKLKIPFYVFNMEEEFKKDVVEYFVNSYLKGYTPNPCILCNQKIKFDHLIKRIRKIGASKVATGHYASIIKKDEKTSVIKRGFDRHKDQSYFLFNLNNDQLKNVLLPLGGFVKADIRKKAKQLGLPVYEKRDSQEICFIPDNNYGKFLKERLEPDSFSEGNIVNKKGEVLGRHKGTIFYTVGQRKRLGISNKFPLYVLKIEKEKNIIVVGEKKDLKEKIFFVRNVNWLINIFDETPVEADVQIRYRHKASKAIIKILAKNKAMVTFYDSQSGISPGQAAVFYKGDEVIGGGWISKDIK